MIGMSTTVSDREDDLDDKISTATVDAFRPVLVKTAEFEDVRGESPIMEMPFPIRTSLSFTNRTEKPILEREMEDAEEVETNREPLDAR
jgi:hypothetical protein